MGEAKVSFNYVPKTVVCSCCGEAKPESDFYKQSYTGKLSNQCKQCVNIKRSVQRNKRRHNKFVSKEKCRTGDIPEFTLAEWKECMLHFKGCCAYCGKPEGRAKADKLDRDHLVPISKGGKTIKTNIVPACRTCNRGRGNRDWQSWYHENKYYSAEREQRIIAWVNKQESED